MPLFAKSEKKERCDLLKLSGAFAFSMSGLLYIVGFIMLDSLGDLKRHSNNNKHSQSALSKAFNASDMGIKIEMLGGGDVSLGCEKKEEKTEFGNYPKKGCYEASIGADPSRPGKVIYPRLDAGLK